MYLSWMCRTLEDVHASGDRWRLGRRPGLDGLRGAAILLVVISHLGVARLEPLGGVGVTVFFTLSGFLITALLLQERDVRGRTRFGRFYAHRALRLAPAFVVCVAVVIVLERWRFGSSPYAWAPFLEVSNWISATHGAGELMMLHHTWSLSIEEQFYLAWPAILVLASKAGRRGVILAACVGIAASVTVAQLVSGPRLSYGTDANAASLLIGCLLAAMMVGRQVPAAPRWMLPVGLALVATGWHPPVAWVPFVPVGAAVTIWTLCTGGASVLAWRPLRLAGMVSYAWYLWNYPITLLALSLGLRLWVVPFVSLALAAASWFLVEQPFLRLKDRQISDQTSMTAAPIGPPAYRFQVPDGNARHAHL